MLNASNASHLTESSRHTSLMLFRYHHHPYSVHEETEVQGRLNNLLEVKLYEAEVKLKPMGL